MSSSFVDREFARFGEIEGKVFVSMKKADCYGGRRVHVRITGLPGWLLEILWEADALQREASSYPSDRVDESGPHHVLYGSRMVVATVEPKLPPEPSAARAETEDEGESE